MKPIILTDSHRDKLRKAARKRWDNTTPERRAEIGQAISKAQKERYRKFMSTTELPNESNELNATSGDASTTPWWSEISVDGNKRAWVLKSEAEGKLARHLQVGDGPQTSRINQNSSMQYV